MRDLPSRSRLVPTRTRPAHTRGRLGCTALACLVCATLQAQVPAPVSVRFSAGQLVEQVTAAPEGLVQDELVPDQPFGDPLPPVPLERLRNFLDEATPSLALTSPQLAAIQRAAQTDPAIAARVAQLVAAARQSLDTPLSVPPPIVDPLALAPEELSRRAADMQTIAAIRSSCAIAFAFTGEERFAAQAWEALTLTIGSFYRHGAVRWVCDWTSPWDEAAELLEAARTYDLIAHWEGLRQTDSAVVFCYLRRLGTRLAYAVELSPVIGNQQAVWTGNLGAVACWAPSIPEADGWVRSVEGRLPGLLADFMPDGGHIECTPDLHAAALRALARYALQRERAGLGRAEGPAPDMDGLSGALGWLARIATPGGWLPGLNDSPPLRPLPDFLLASLARHANPDKWPRAVPTGDALDGLLAAVSESAPWRSPTQTSILLPDTGLAILRDGWKPADTCLLLDFGRHGGPHGHLDKLSFEMHAGGDVWIPDAGWPLNPAEAARDGAAWYRTTRAHNTILVDGASQPPVDGTLAQWHTDPRYDLAAGEFAGYPDLLHRRTIVHPRGGYVLVLDELHNRSDQERQIEWRANVNGVRESGTAGRLVFWRQDRTGLSIISARGSGIRRAQMGEGNCVLPGKAPDDAATVQAVPWVALQRAVPPHADTAMAVLLLPFATKEPPCTVDLQDTGSAWGVEVRIGAQRDRYLVRKTTAGRETLRGLGLVTDGNYALVRETAGEVTLLEVLGGDSLSIG